MLQRNMSLEAEKERTKMTPVYGNIVVIVVGSVYCFCCKHWQTTFNKVKNFLIRKTRK